MKIAKLAIIPVASLLLAFSTHAAADRSSALVDFGSLASLAGNGEFVEVNLKANVIAMAAKLAEKAEPKVAELLRGLQLVRVNVLNPGEDHRAELESKIKSIRSDLAAKAWERIVTAQKKGEDVSVYLKTKGEEMIEGLVVTVVGHRGEVVLVNIVGNLRPEQISMVGERLNIDPLKKIGQDLKKESTDQPK